MENDLEDFSKCFGLDSQKEVAELVKKGANFFIPKPTEEPDDEAREAERRLKPPYRTGRAKEIAWLLEYVTHEDDRIAIAVAVYNPNDDDSFTFEIAEIAVILRLSRQGAYNILEQTLIKLKRRANSVSAFPRKADMILRDLRDYYA